MLSLLVAFGVKYGWVSLLMYYFIPYVVRSSSSKRAPGPLINVLQLCNHWYAPLNQRH